MTEPPRKKRIVILGGGFGGLECCKRLRDDTLEVTLIDRQNHHLFQPLLYQVATAGLSAPDIAQPIRAILEKQKNVTVLMEEATAVDLERRQVVTANREVPYDYLVIALGMKSGYFGNETWKNHAPGLKTLDQATGIRQRVLAAFERAENCADAAEVSRLTTIVVIGGGPTGVELAGAFAELARKALRETFRHIDTSQSRVVLVEAAPRVLGMYSDELSTYAGERLEAMGVEVRTGCPVREITEHRVELEGETIEAETIVWAAGLEAPPIVKTLGVETGRAGRLKVEPDLSLPGHREVFAIGDIASCVDGRDVEVPMLAPAAIQMGRHVAGIIRNETRIPGDDLEPYADVFRNGFTYLDKGTMATIGRSSAVASSFGMQFKGWFAWILWLAIHLLLLVGLRNKLSVMLSWTWSYLHYEPGARIIVRKAPPPASPRKKAKRASAKTARR